MSTVKHTPGPWILDDRGDRIAIHQPDGAPVWLGEVASVEMSNLDVEQDATARANAQLITAAPDLSDALLAIYRHDGPPGANDPCHAGLVPMADCSRCGPLLRAEKALRAAGRLP